LNFLPKFFCQVEFFAAEISAVLLNFHASEFSGIYAGQTEAKLRKVFSEAHEIAAGGSPVVLFLDDIVRTFEYYFQANFQFQKKNFKNFF
jgi:SpoVK/Ycf46/Vps4 family AAA+-type ATPase